MNKIWVSVIICLLPLLATAHTEDAEVEGVIIDKIVGRIDNFIVLKSEVERGYLDYLNRAEDFDFKDGRCRVFENLIINKLLVA